MIDTEFTDLLHKSPQECHRLLMKEYGRYVYAIVYNKLRSYGSSEDIDECISDVFSDLFLAIDAGNCTDIKKLLGTIAKRRAVDYFRSLSSRNGRSVPMEEEDIQNMASEFDVERIAERNEIRRVLLNTIASLGEPDATIILQKFYYSRSSSEIAAALSMNPSSVRSRCTRAMKKLRSLLESKGISA
ncbi:MAG: sigma-70 family RNA polymerase sigma factor [Oscillospiraceae bacterium]|nr:sigma-70 family RNA polymerase sigma factor [Oscillospiraceae bacterium]